jgi:hypothetical protein
MAAIFSGRCMCGAVTYECSAAPIVMGNCHCRDCQRATGTAYAAGMLVALDMVRIQGEVKYYDVVGESGLVISRGFCPVCGSRLFGKGARSPNSMSIMAGSLDDPTFFKPQADIFTASAQAWDHLNPRLPKFSKMPPSP